MFQELRGWSAGTLMVALSACSACGRGNGAPPTTPSPYLPLVLVADVGLPGGATRFDYQEIDPVQAHLVVAHMNDASVLVLSLGDGASS